MIDEKEFYEIVKKIWKKIFKETYVPFETVENFDDFLRKLYLDIINFDYFPSNPREYVISNKHNLVTRIIPILSTKDICVYYYCVKKLENYLAKNRIEGTFGGFSMGGIIREKENEEFNDLLDVPFSSSPYTYNPIAWVNAWRDFQKKAFIYSNSSEDYCYFIKFDIANFYDCINLSLLEKKVREASDKEFSEHIDLLFHFLGKWNRKFNNYFPKTVGIPQDEVGDCSRILANFYLQSFDEYLFNYCEKNKLKYLRYSDDMIIMGENLISVKRGLYYASKELSKIGLNVNSSKVEIFKNKEEFDRYWAFDIFDKLGDKEDVKNIELAIDKYIEYSKYNINFRKSSVLIRLLGCNLKKIDKNKREAILNEVIDDDFLSNCEEFVIRYIYKNISNISDRDKLQEKLKNLIDVIYFNKFHYVLLKLTDIFDFDKELLNTKIKELKL